MLRYVKLMRFILTLSLFNVLISFFVMTCNRDVRKGAAPVLGYRVLQQLPHDTQAFTEGLAYSEGFLYESTGINGESSVRQVALNTGKTIKRYDLDKRYFGEGLALWGDKLIQLTYDTEVGFVYDLRTLRLNQSFSLKGGGWGLTSDGDGLIMSDGTDVLRFLDPNTFKETRRIIVKDAGSPVTMINELEYVDGSILANVFQTDRLVRIDPKTGNVMAWIDLSGLLTEEERKGPTVEVDGKTYPMNVLNGIAYDSVGHRLFVTGKRWPKLFEIEITDKK